MQPKTFIALFESEFKECEDSPFKIRDGFLKSDRIGLSWEGPLLSEGANVYLGDRNGLTVKVSNHFLDLGEGELYIDCSFGDEDLEELMASAEYRQELYAHLLKQGWASLDPPKPGT